MINRIITTILILITFFPAISRAADFYDDRKPPKLVVEIIVSHMRYDYLTRFSANMSPYGFRRLLSQGTNYTNARYEYMFTQISPGVATISTGCQPAQHGIIGDGWINYTTNEDISAIYDKTVRGVGCNEDEGQYSPRNLVVSTVADEVKRNNARSKVVSIAMEPRGAVLSGGYSPDGVYWYDVRYGGFVTSNYYMPTLPPWVQAFNNSSIKDDYATKLWHIFKSKESYKYQNATSILLDSAKKFSFEVLFKGKNKDFNSLVENPFGNSYIKDFALEAIRKDSLGLDESPDLLIVNFGAGHAITQKYGIESTELEDSYYRLDADIAEMIDYLENNIGKENFVIVLTSENGTSDNVRADRGASSGTFNAMQFKVLISGFLGATLGVDEWVSAYKNRQIYLNRRLIYEKGLSLTEIQSKVAIFALQFGGVANAVTATSLQNNYYGKGILQNIQNSYFAKHSGDVIINLLPGWIELENEDASWVKSSSGSPYEYDTHVPLIWYGAKINGDVEHRQVDMIDLAPTISEIMNVTHPNASEGNALKEIVTNL